MNTALALFLLRLAPSLLSFLLQAVETLREKQMLDSGEAKAVAKALAASAKAKGLADAFEIEIEKLHQKDNTDGAFINEFERKD